MKDSMKNSINNITCNFLDKKYSEKNFSLLKRDEQSVFSLFKTGIEKVLLYMESHHNVIVKSQIEFFIHGNQDIELIRTSHMHDDIYKTDVFTKCFNFDLTSKQSFFMFEYNSAQVYINMDFIQHSFNESIERENMFFESYVNNLFYYTLTFYIHGFLHALNLNHKTTEEQNYMFGIERELQSFFLFNHCGNEMCQHSSVCNKGKM